MSISQTDLCTKLEATLKDSIACADITSTLKCNKTVSSLFLGLLQRLKLSLVPENELDLFSLATANTLLETLDIIFLPLPLTDPKRAYQVHFRDALLKCLQSIKGDVTTPLSLNEFKQLHEALVVPIHLKMAKRELTEDEIIQTHLTPQMIHDMFELLDKIIPQEKKVRHFDFLGRCQKGQSLRGLLNEFKQSTTENALDNLKTIIFHASTHRFRNQDRYQARTDTVNKILDALSQQDKAELRQAFFGYAALTRKELDAVFVSYIKEKDLNYPPPYKGL